MRKILFTTAIISLLFASCDKERSNKEIAKLPSKIASAMSVWSFNDIPENWEPNSFDTTIYQYDNLNRLTKIISGNDTIEIIYNRNENNPIKTMRGREVEYTFEYSHNQVTIYSNNLSYEHEIKIVLTIDANGRITKEQRYNWYNDHYFSPIIKYSYNSNGNLIGLVPEGGFYEETHSFIYSNILSIWRDANVPDWFMYWYGIGSKKGYMLSEHEWEQHDRPSIPPYPLFGSENILMS